MDIKLRNLKTLILIVIIGVVACQPKQEIVLGIPFQKTKTKIFQLDNSLWETYYEYKDRDGNFQFGQFIEGKRNDSVFVKGFRLMEKDTIIMRKKYFYGIVDYDSTETKLVKNKFNKVELKEYREFKGGKIIRKQLF